MGLSSVFLAVWVTPVLLLIMPVLMLAIYVATSVARKPIVDALRYDAMSRSAVNSFFVAALSNLPTIRAYQQSEWLRRRFEDNLVEENGRCYFSFLSFSCWLGMQINLTIQIFIFSALVAIFFAPASAIASAAVLITSIFQLKNTFQFAIRVAMEATSSLASVERMQEYTHLPQEPPRSLPDDPQPGEWPTDGLLEIEDLSVRHRADLPLVLKKVSLGVPPGSKVGVVGRTGAGKSSLLQALFRMVEAQSGSISIDHRDIFQMGLEPLRSCALSLLPQTPVLFSGSLRDNLDPF